MPLAALRPMRAAARRAAPMPMPMRMALQRPGGRPPSHPPLTEARGGERCVLPPHCVVVLDSLQHGGRLDKHLSKALEQRQRHDVEEPDLCIGKHGGQSRGGAGEGADNICWKLWNSGGATVSKHPTCAGQLRGRKQAREEQVSRLGCRSCQQLCNSGIITKNLACDFIMPSAVHEHDTSYRWHTAPPSPSLATPLHLHQLHPPATW